VGLLAWLIPGAGHFLLKKKKHALVIFATIVLTFCAGLYVGSLGVINWDRAKPWYVAQIMNSPIVIILGDHVAGWLLFSIGSEFQSDLDNGIVSERLQQAFKNNKAPLSQDATVLTEQQRGYIYKWLITGNKCSYSVRRENGKLNVYTAYPVYGRPNEIGQIYTSIAGLLNLLCIVNAVYLAHLRKTETAGDSKCR